MQENGVTPVELTIKYIQNINNELFPPAKNPYVAEMYKLALEGKLYSRICPIDSKDR
jgi:hypothetical protein